MDSLERPYSPAVQTKEPGSRMSLVSFSQKCEQIFATFVGFVPFVHARIVPDIFARSILILPPLFVHSLEMKES